MATTHIAMIVGLIFSVATMRSANALKETLRLGTMVSQEGELDYSGQLLSLDLALQTVNRDPSLLYAFNKTLNDSMCLPAASLRGFIDQIFLSEASAQNHIMLIGPDCSITSEPIAEIAPNWNLVQISAASTSPRLSDNRTFPLFLRSIPSDAEIDVAMEKAMKHFGWSRIAIITQSENIFTFLSAQLRRHFSTTNIQILNEYTLSTEKDVPGIVRELQKSPARIIFLAMYEENGAKIICEAAKRGLTFPEYQWMFLVWYTDSFWMASNTNCLASDDALMDVVQNSLLFDYYPQLTEEEKDQSNVGGITWNYFNSYYDENIERYRISNESRLANKVDAVFMFDAVWTAALAINSTASKLPDGVTLKDFMYNGELSNNISRTLYEEALNVKFFGLSGNVSYRKNGDRPGGLTFLQLRRNGSSLTRVRYASLKNNSIVYNKGENDGTVFPDGRAEDEEHIYITPVLFIIYTILSLLGICFAITCLLFNIWFRDQKLVKRTSPYVNVMIIAGAVVFYIIVILFGVDENVASSSTVDHLCQTRIWLVAIGFSLLFGTIFAKTWRVYYVFHVVKPNSKIAAKDKYLFAIVAALVLTDVIIMIPPTVIPGAILRRETEEIEGNEGNDVPQIIGVCESDGSLIWLPIIFGYKAFVLMAGLFLAFETRKVKYTALNESRFVGMSVYGTVVVSMALTPIGFLLHNFPSIQYSILGMMILLSTTLILGLIFTSKMYKVYYDPKGTEVEKNHENLGTKCRGSTIDFVEEDYKKKIESLNVEIKALTDTLRSNNLVIHKSTDSLLSSSNVDEVDASK